MYWSNLTLLQGPLSHLSWNQVVWYGKQSSAFASMIFFMALRLAMSNHDLIACSVALPNAIKELGQFTLLSALQSYLRQAEIAAALELIRDEIDKMVLALQNVSI